jgi:hypothetical protein
LYWKWLKVLTSQHSRDTSLVTLFQYLIRSNSLVWTKRILRLSVPCMRVTMWRLIYYIAFNWNQHVSNSEFYVFGMK